MGLSSEIKPLYANLSRLGILEYVGTKEYEELMIELDLDEEWTEALSNTKVMDSDHYTDAQYEEAFIDFFDERFQRYFFLEFVTKLILDFAKWSNYKLDIYEIHQNFIDLEFKKKEILLFEKEFRKIRDKKPISIENNPIELNSKKVFIVHGHDRVARLELEKFLRDDLGFDPVVLQDQLTDSIETIIGKLERLAKDCLYAVILMTPDDETADNQKRARQNVVLELGYFIGRYSALGHGKVVLIKKGDLEKPSDIDGVLYYPYTNNIEETFYKLGKQFKAWISETE